MSLKKYKMASLKEKIEVDKETKQDIETEKEIREKNNKEQIKENKEKEKL